MKKIETVFQSIIDSSNRPVPVAEGDLFLLALLMRSIDYNEKSEKANSSELTKFISTIGEAVSLLSTPLHLVCIQFLGEHLIEFLKSGMFEKIDEQIILDVIDIYIEKSQEQQRSEIMRDYKQIFDLFKDRNEPIFLIHLLLQIDEKLFDSDMTEYVIKNIDGEIAQKEMPAFAEIAKKYFRMRQEKFNVFRFNYTGSLQTIEIQEDGHNEIEATGAAGSGGNTYCSGFKSQGGKGAKIVANFSLKKGDVIDIVVGGMGTSKQAIAKDGTSGGGTFIFKRIDKITDERYQFTKGNINYETLLVVAGGSGGEDSAHIGGNSFGHDGEASNYKSPSNYTEYSKNTNDGQSSSNVNIMGISQFIQYNATGSFFMRANGISRGGYGCGASQDDAFAPGGGWCQGSKTYQATSWSLDTKAIGTDGINNDNGSVTFK